MKIYTMTPVFAAVLCGLSFGAAMAATVSETFEGDAVGEKPSGWDGSCKVQTASSSYAKTAMPGYPVQGEGVTHAQILTVEGTAVREYSAGESGNRVVDLMVMADELPDEEALPAATGDEQIKLAFDKDGCINLYHRATAAATEGVWTKLSGTVYAAGTWVRVTFVFDYSTAAAPMCQVKVDGSPCVTALGFRSPSQLTTNGSWYYTVKSSATSLAKVDFAGCGGVDDVVNAETSAANPYVPAYAADNVEGVAVAWLDQNALPWDVAAAAPGASGYTVAQAYSAGVDPYGANKLYVANAASTGASTLRLTINGSGATYAIYKSAVPFAGSVTGTEVTGGTWTVNDNNTTTWEGAFPTDDLTYLKVTATRNGSVETINQFAIKKIASSAANTLVALPWKTLTPSATEPAAITAANVVLPDTLSDGDYLLYYDGGFKGWVLTGGQWVPLTTTTTIGTIKANPATATELQRGQAIWVVRQSTANPFYLCGQYLAKAADESATVAAGGSLLANPDMTAAFAVSASSITGAAVGDTIVVPAAADALPTIYEKRAAGWGYVETKTETVGGRNITTSTFKTDGEMKIPAGRGFMYNPKSTGVTIKW